MRTVKTLFILILLSFISCKGEEDSYIYPPIIFEFATVQTDATGVAVSLKTDKGVTYDVNNFYSKNRLLTNARVRVICYYTLIREDSKTEIDIYSIGKTISPTPEIIRFEKDRKTDPVNIQSVWLAGDYINSTIQVKAQNKTHYLKFMEDAITLDKGIPTVHITLYHDKNSDLEAYNQTAYTSIPLEKYIKQYPNGFNISYNINTYNGIETHLFSYQ